MYGKIVKAIAGFYYVDVAESGIYKCRAKGVFRKEGKKPLVGDDVCMDVTHEGDREGNVTEILPRKNELFRPSVANIDQVLIFFALKTPDPNYLLIDRFLISASLCRIPGILCFNKTDAANEDEISEVRENYRNCGFPLHFVSVRKGEGIEELSRLLEGRTTALAGPSGSGKSSLTNALSGTEAMEVGDISKKLARGKNTTRHIELLRVGRDTFLCDTPGFSALDTEGLLKHELKEYFAEFNPYEGKCRFQGCVHIGEPDCAVKEAVRAGVISQRRYDNYAALYEELKDAERRRYQ